MESMLSVAILSASETWVLWKDGSFRKVQSPEMPGILPYLEDPNLLKLRSLDSSCPFFLSDNSSGFKSSQPVTLTFGAVTPTFGL